MRIQLSGQRERCSPDNPYPQEFTGTTRPLLHQVCTARATAAIVLNTHATGAGKTRAAFLRFLESVRADGREPRNCLLIAPTNELLRQHVRDAEHFVERHQLPHVVVLIDAAVVHDLDLLGLPRGGAKLHAVLRDPRVLDARARRAPLILVVNPDIFYCALFFRYGTNDQRNLFRDFLTQFDTVIIDEFHYYNAKQFANFLFFFTLCQDYGYFQSGPGSRQIILLSATPSTALAPYLRRLDVTLESIAPEDESTAGESVPALAPVELDLLPSSSCANGVAGLVEQRTDQLIAWVREGLHGAIISDALWRINASYALLRGPLAGRVGRLTGAEARAARNDAVLRDLLLATPTVDIGYNFERAAKTRQSLDFLLFDANNADAFLQRLGRAGRVLGKQQVDQPSRVIAVVPDELIAALQPHDGGSLERSELAAIVRETLRPQHSLTGYIAHAAIDETFLPIFKLLQMSGRQERERIEALYRRVYAVFAPSGRRPFWKLERQTKEYLTQETFDRQATEQQWMDRFIDAYAQQHQQPKPEAATRQQVYPLFANPALFPIAMEYRQWKEQAKCAFAVQHARFSFRDCLQLPAVVVLDPQHLLAEADVTRYDLLHVAQNYEATYYLGRAEWCRATGQDPEAAPEAPFYATLQRQRSTRPKLFFRLEQPHLERTTWEEKHCNTITALLDLQLRLENTSLDRQVLDALRQTPVVALLVAKDAAAGSGLSADVLTGVTRRHCWREGIIPRDVRVVHPEGEHDYLLIAGTAALQIEAELHGRLARAAGSITKGIII